MKHDIGKAPIYNLIEKYNEAIKILSIARLYGDMKYGISSSWRRIEIDKEDYLIRIKNSICRHLMGGMENDKESGLPHIIHTIFQLLNFIEFENSESPDPFIKFNLSENELSKKNIKSAEDWRAEWENIKNEIYQKKRNTGLGEILVDYSYSLTLISTCAENDLIPHQKNALELFKSIADLLFYNEDDSAKSTTYPQAALNLIKLLDQNFTVANIFFNEKIHE